MVLLSSQTLKLLHDTGRYDYRNINDSGYILDTLTRMKKLPIYSKKLVSLH